ncbi:TPA: hypothetical protein ACGO62_000496 [Streptococcus suis]
MNKRIKKKKAKQAELRRQQELEELLQNPETIRQVLRELGMGISRAFYAFAIVSANLSRSFEEWSKQF